MVCPIYTGEDRNCRKIILIAKASYMLKNTNVKCLKQI